jgi:hypothetical protein
LCERASLRGYATISDTLNLGSNLFNYQFEYMYIC